MDLYSLKPNTQTLEILHPESQDPIGLKLEIYSGISDEYLKGVREGRQKYLEVLKERHANGYEPSNDQAVDPEQMIEVVASVKGWQWHSGLKCGGEASPKFSTEKLKEVLTSEGMAFIALQIKLTKDGGKSFFPKLQTSTTDT